MTCGAVIELDVGGDDGAWLAIGPLPNEKAFVRLAFAARSPDRPDGRDLHLYAVERLLYFVFSILL